MSWYTEGPKTAPAANTVLAQTPPVAESSYTVQFVMSATLGFRARLDICDSTGAPVYSQVIAVPANETKMITFIAIDVPPDGFARLVVLAVVTLVQVQASISI